MTLEARQREMRERIAKAREGAASDNAQLSSGHIILPILSPLKSVLCEVLPTRFWTLISARPDGCWQWLGSTRSSKYKGRRYRYATYNGKYAHRVIFEALNGSIPPDLEIDHICHNKTCVNPKHLQAITHQQNCARRPKSGPYPKADSVRSRQGLYAGRAQ